MVDYFTTFIVFMYLFNIIELIGFNAITISLYSPLTFLESSKLTSKDNLVQIGVHDNESDQIVNKKINPWFVTGFCDAEASFSLNINKDTSNKFGLKVQIIFQIGLHKRDKALLEQIQRSFWCR